MIQYSIFQKAIFDFAINGSGHALVNAVAGSGKTFTLLETMKQIKGNCVFLAFNKSIADELAKKVPAHVTACTLHSLGFKAIRNASQSKVIVESRKLDILMDSILGLATYKGMTTEERSLVMSLRATIKAMVSITKATLTDYTNKEDVIATCDKYGVDFDGFELFKRVMEKSIAQTNIIDFDDMIYFPVINKYKMDKFDWVFVDESQDLNRAQIELVLSIVKQPNGRIFAVGDPYQSIYGFRGADTEAMNRIKEALNAKELPLSVCYRCPTSHIDLAKDIVSHITAHDTAPKGIIENIKAKDFVESIISSRETKTEPLVLCRINAPLVSLALSLIAQNIPAIVRGRDIATNLITIVKKLKASSIESLFTNLNDYRITEYKKLTNRNAPAIAFDTLNDKIETIKVIADNASSPDDVIQKIDSLFSDNDDHKVRLSTIHKAKGLEADIVYITKPNLLPLIRKNQQAWELVQEMNIKYVALTRAKSKLIFVNDI